MAGISKAERERRAQARGGAESDGHIGGLVEERPREEQVADTAADPSGEFPQMAEEAPAERDATLDSVGRTSIAHLADEAIKAMFAAQGAGEGSADYFRFNTALEYAQKQLKFRWRELRQANAG